ncbi:MAG: hypothetical protein JO257_13720 [Deltaproteobacteria bacterium]|nr:hypothetical protein [Deltaproteobacteria bacterium]
MRTSVAIAIAAVAFAGARGARVVAEAARHEATEEPFAVSPGAAPYVSGGYRELGADLFWIRLTGYFGGGQSTARGIAGLVDAITALDPHFHRVYEWGARAMTLAHEGVTQETYVHAIAVLERGMTQFPDDWKLPYLAGQIYTQDLQTTDPAQRRAWDDKGTLLIESAIRKPGAPAEAAEWAAVMRTKLGQHDRAVKELREMILVTEDRAAREALIKRLAKLENANSDELAAEVLETRRRFEEAWHRDRPDISATMYILLGPRLTPHIDMTNLATGGHDLVGSEPPPEPLEPLP